MKITLSWLKDHLDTTASLDTILETLTKIGLEVDAVKDLTQVLDPFKVAKITATTPHPEADRLKICQVDVGTGSPLQIVCGGPNARAGITVVLAPIGVTIPTNGLVIKESKIRGVESHGMLCSLDELGLGEGGGSIIELPEATPLGTPVADALHASDPVIEIGLTPNRGDCAGVRGIARDLAAAGLGTLKPLKPVKHTDVVSKPLVHLDAPEGACPQFGACLIRGVKNGPSPEWLRRKLESIGEKSISALVDVTNYFTFDQSRPLHVFDAAKLTGNLTVRLAKGGESFLALNKETYELTNQDVAIFDESGTAVSLGGIMGGLDSGVTQDTTDVLVECALFDPIGVALTGRHHGIHSDARYRFERGMDPASVVPGISQAVDLIQELCGGTPGPIQISGTEPQWRRSVTMRFARLKSLTGLDLSPTESADYLKGLGFVLTHDDVTLTAQVPSWRVDVNREEDLIEEVTRLYGLDRLPPVSLPRKEGGFGGAYSPFTLRSSKIRRTLAGRGMAEAITWSFLSSTDAERFGGGHADLKILNPISQDLSDLRPSILPNLLRAASRNRNHGVDRGALFEVGPIYRNLTPEGQIECVSAVRFGTNHADHWQKEHRNVTPYDVKADVVAVLDLCGLDTHNFQIIPGAPAWFHPGRSATIQQGPKTILGYFGELHPSILEALDLDGPVMGFEVFLSAMPARKPKAKKTFIAPTFQAVERDFAFLVAAQTPGDALVQAAAKTDPKLITDVTLFDVYAGKGIPEGFKSIALRVRIQPTTATLTDQDINALSEKIMTTITQKTGASLRA